MRMGWRGIRIWSDLSWGILGGTDIPVCLAQRYSSTRFFQTPPPSTASEGRQESTFCICHLKSFSLDAPPGVQRELGGDEKGDAAGAPDPGRQVVEPLDR